MRKYLDILEPKARELFEEHISTNGLDAIAGLTVTPWESLSKEDKDIWFRQIDPDFETRSVVEKWLKKNNLKVKKKSKKKIAKLKRKLYDERYACEQYIRDHRRFLFEVAPKIVAQKDEALARVAELETKLANFESLKVKAAEFEVYVDDFNHERDHLNEQLRSCHERMRPFQIAAFAVMEEKFKHHLNTDKVFKNTTYDDWAMISV